MSEPAQGVQGAAKNLFSKEPALATGGSLGVLVVAVIAMLRSFGVNLPDDFENNASTIILILASLPVVTGLATRFLVVSPNTAAKKVAEAYVAEPGVDNVPKIAVQGYNAALEKTEAAVAAPNVDAKR